MVEVVFYDPATGEVVKYCQIAGSLIQFEADRLDLSPLVVENFSFADGVTYRVEDGELIEATDAE